MAELITYPNKDLDGIIVNDVFLGEWVLGSGEVGVQVKTGNFSDQNIHFHGVFGGGSVALRGSNKADADADVASDWFVVRAAHDGSDISLVTTFYGAVILESVMWLSPIVSGGDGSTQIKCSIKANKRN